MNAILTTKNNKYYVVIDYKDTLGQRQRKWIPTGLDIKNNQKKAEEIRRAELRKFEDSYKYLLNPMADILFADWIEDWLEKLKPSLELSSYGGYLKNVERISAYFRSKKIKLTDMKPMDIANYYQWLQENGSSIMVCEHHHVNIRKCLESAVKQNLIPFNPADRIDRPKSPKHISDYYNLEELNDFFKCIENDPYKIVYYITAYYGLRRSELVGLKWTSIDLISNKIVLKHAVVETNVDHKQVIIEKDRMKNTSSYRTLPLLPFIKTMLLEWREKKNENKKYFGNTYNKKYDDYICVRDNGDRMKPSTISSHFRDVLKKNKLRKIKFMELRHSCASLLLSQGVSMSEIQAWLGHSNYHTTANTYAHLDDSKKKDVANKLQGVHNTTEKVNEAQAEEMNELDRQLKEIEDLIQMKKELIKKKYNLSEMM